VHDVVLVVEAGQGSHNVFVSRCMGRSMQGPTHDMGGVGMWLRLRVRPPRLVLLVTETDVICFCEAAV
jgi:hypothetical protein